MRLVKRGGLLCALLAAVAIASVVGISLVVDKAGKDAKPVQKADVIIVPGAKVQDGQVSDTLMARLDKGLKLYQQTYAPKMIVSGDHGQKDYDEVNAMRNYLIKRGVPAEDIFMDHAGFDTYSTMYRARDIFCVKSAIVSSQDYHNARAVYIGRKLGLEVYAADAEDVYVEKWRAVREPLARVKAWLEVNITKPKPKYLGEPIPVSGNGMVTEDKN